MTQQSRRLPPRLTILRRREVEARIGLSRSTIYQRVAEDPSCPQPVNLGGRAVGWVEEEVEAWLQKQIASSRAKLRDE